MIHPQSIYSKVYMYIYRETEKRERKRGREREKEKDTCLKRFPTWPIVCWLHFHIVAYNHIVTFI